MYRSYTPQRALAPYRVGLHCCKAAPPIRIHLAVSVTKTVWQYVAKAGPSAHRRNKAIHWPQILMRRLAEWFSLRLHYGAGSLR
jgi:hypothetical protein